MSSQDQKTIFITGSSSGLGRAIANLFASKVTHLTHPRKTGPENVSICGFVKAVLWTTGGRMRKNFTSEQMLYTVRQAESVTPVAELCRKMESQNKPSTSGSNGWRAWPTGVLESELVSLRC